MINSVVGLTELSTKCQRRLLQTIETEFAHDWNPKTIFTRTIDLCHWDMGDEWPRRSVQPLQMLFTGHTQPTNLLWNNIIAWMLSLWLAITVNERSSGCQSQYVTTTAVFVYLVCLPAVCSALAMHKSTSPSQIAKFMEPTWGPPGSCLSQMGHMLAPWALLSGVIMQRPM